MNLMDTPKEERFDRIVELTQLLFQVPMANISLIDKDRQWFKSKVGIEAKEISRDVSFCAHAILEDQAMVVPDALQDYRFAANPMVLEEPFIRFYAGQPLRAPSGHKVGTLCLVDKEAREFKEHDLKLLAQLGKLVEREFTLLDKIQMQIEMLKVQQWAQATGAKVCILFEGRDAAGKGGAIRRFTEHTNPRSARVVALPKPSDVERTQWYFQRYVAHLPSAGEIVFFDRSWYNRAVVEPVMGYCTTKQRDEFFEQVPGFEQQLVDSGIRLFKLWFTVSQGEQLRRFEGRSEDPLKQWKLSPNDEASVTKFAEYGKARDRMMRLSDTRHAPWTIVNSNVKKLARLEAMRHVLHELPYDHKDTDIVTKADPRVVQPAAALTRRR